MCNLYAITKSQEAIRQAAKALRDKAGNVPSLPGRAARGRKMLQFTVTAFRKLVVAFTEGLRNCCADTIPLHNAWLAAPVRQTFVT
jgi:hypothetical protein